MNHVRQNGGKVVLRRYIRTKDTSDAAHNLSLSLVSLRCQRNTGKFRYLSGASAEEIDQRFFIAFAFRSTAGF